jgi:type 1 glutamine amidotransferase
MKQKALIVWGGWDGHEPDKVAAIFNRTLTEEGFDVEVSDSLNAFADTEKLKELDLIIPIWTMGEIDGKYVENVSEAVANGTGLAGCHGGMCDAFRKEVLWQFMTGGNWVSHPGGDGVEYPVNIRNCSSPLVQGIKDFTVKSEQYYLHIDPAVEVLATTPLPQARWYHSANGHVDMPVVWTKKWAVGRVFYNALGHHADVFEIPEPIELMRRGFLWAAEGRKISREKGLSSRLYDGDTKNF